MSSPKIAILYTELADYFVACLRELSKENVELFLMHWPINQEAPFSFDLSFVDQCVSKERFSRSDLRLTLDAFKPDLILCSGWVDRDYLAVCKTFKKKCITVVAFDNQWRGSARQWLAATLSPFFIKRAFSHAFVPGEAQAQFARRLGIKEDNIALGFYSADTPRFDSFHSSIRKKWDDRPPKRILFLGRYVKQKGIIGLWDAFESCSNEFPEWELWCVGTGPLFQRRRQAKRIKHFGFLQPADLLPILEDCSVYILPSQFEPWGVSVHEMAVSGFPLILSSSVGSKEQFLEEDKNGYTFEAGNSQELIQAIRKMIGLSDSERLQMSDYSHKLGMSNSPTIWSSKLLKFLSSNSVN